MKVSVITLAKIHNYGSTLQAFATDYLIKSLGCDVEFVDYVGLNGSKRDTFENAFVRHGFKGKSLKSLLYTLAWNIDWYYKESIFVKFAKNNMSFSRHYNTNKDLESDPPLADVYLSGSDMLWSSVLNNGHKEKQYYLNFAPENKKKIAFSASIGETKLDENEKAFLKEQLFRYDAISMREASGVDLLEEMGIPSTRTLDPTLMMTSVEWSNFARLPKRKKPYLLVYFIHEHPDVLEFASDVAKSMGLDLVRVAFNPRKKTHDQYLAIMPKIEEFVGLFNAANYVITDSFHGTAFSLNFSKDFLVTSPPRFMTRLDNVLQMTDTQDRVIEELPFDINGIAPIEWNKVSSVLDAERKKSFDYLKEAIFS